MGRVYISQSNFTEIVSFQQRAKEMRNLRKTSWTLFDNDKQPSVDPEIQLLIKKRKTLKSEYKIPSWNF
jgi:hypothetical protein